jgi:Mrp family chromosome partitioning ATPase
MSCLSSDAKMREQKGARESPRPVFALHPVHWIASMSILAFASRKGGAGKSTLAAHLAAHVHRSTRPCLLVDDDPQGSLTL